MLRARQLLLVWGFGVMAVLPPNTMQVTAIIPTNTLSVPARSFAGLTLLSRLAASAAVFLRGSQPKEI